MRISYHKACFLHCTLVTNITMQCIVIFYTCLPFKVKHCLHLFYLYFLLLKGKRFPWSYQRPICPSLLLISSHSELPKTFLRRLFSLLFLSLYWLLFFSQKLCSPLLYFKTKICPPLPPLFTLDTKPFFLFYCILCLRTETMVIPFWIPHSYLSECWLQHSFNIFLSIN